MQIIIPMSGIGNRFTKAGYTIPKSLIEIESKPVIAHVIDMFPGETNFIFICNADHLNNPEYRMQEIIKKHCPTGKIIAISPHKLGPIHAVRQIENIIDPNSPTIVNYCDFTCYWDWKHFKHFVKETRCDGSIPAYKGFHPHSLGTTNYAYLLEENGIVEDIQEKMPFTNNRLNEYASSGTYYFSSGRIMLDAFKWVMENDINVGGEYYVSLAYKYLLKQLNSQVTVYPLQHFMQWGTPEDVAEYNQWSTIFKGLTNTRNNNITPSGTVIIPMAGLGQRFAAEGYSITKPLIPVSGQPMVLQAVRDLPPATKYSFVLRKDMPGYDHICTQLKSSFPNITVEVIDHVTDGQACSALLGLDAVERESGYVEGPITIGACDNGMLYNMDTYQNLLENSDIDIIVWAIRGYSNAIRHPNMFGWIAEKNGLITHVSVKQPLDSPKTDPTVLGTFTFKQSSDIRRVLKRLFERNERINGEFYLDSCINDAIELGLRCAILEVDGYLCWGTPNELKTFEYWQSCFHKWDAHPYRLELDTRIAKEEINALEKQYRKITPKFIGIAQNV